MVRKKIDNRLRVIIENGVKLGHRTLFVVVGDKGRDQVVILHHMLSKATIKSRPNVLWCYKKELGFSSHRKKRMKTLQQKIKTGKLNVNEDDPFELFVASTNIRYCYYAETHKILGNTFGMCILQDFEALTPNLLARTIETVEGGGIIIILLRSVTSLKQLYTMSMDVHDRYRTESHGEVVGRFNERFLLSLGFCDRCLVVDDQLTVLPVSSHNLQVEPIVELSEGLDQELNILKETLSDTQPIGALVNTCKTVDQAKALLKFVEAISEKTLRATVSLTAARGRGKSAALGLAMASAVAFGYSNIFVTSPSPENLNTLFEFLFKGFDALEYQEHLDYDLIQSTNPDFNKAIVRVNIFKDHRQTIQYIHPSDAHRLGQAELLVIDEAAAIPLTLVQSMFGPYLIFLASTINGYEGTGRSLSLKLLQQLRMQTTTTRSLSEVVLNESIRYRPNDAVEKWLTSLLCLDVALIQPILSGCPPPNQCELYYINRDTLFCYHSASETFLQRLVALYVASHYKNTPNDLQMMSDAPAHHLFCLLGPIDPSKKSLPEVLVILQVCLEGQVSKSSVADGMSRGKRASGDLIPWTVAQQYQDQEFPQLSGARIVRIASHPDYHGMGYGSRALKLLIQYFEGNIFSLDDVAKAPPPPECIETIPEEKVGLLEENIEPKMSLPPLLLKLSERPPEALDYLGVSYGLTEQLLKFWKRAGFIPVYLRQTTSELTGEHTCIMLRLLNTDESKSTCWLEEFSTDFRRRFVSLLSFQFRVFSPALSLGVLQRMNHNQAYETLNKSQLEMYMTTYDIKRLEMYSHNLVDYHLIMDLLPIVARLYFLHKLGNLHISAVQAAILLGLGLQHKTVDALAIELELASSQLLGLFNRSIRKCVTHLMSVITQDISKGFPQTSDNDSMHQSLDTSLVKELDDVAKELSDQQRKERKKLNKEDFSHFAIKGTEQEWGKALKTGGGGIISVKSGEKRIAEPDDIPVLDEPSKKNRKTKIRKR